MTKDYSITLQDSTDRIAVISINGASIDETIATGSSFDAAEENVIDNAVWAAVRRGEIGEYPTLVAINR